MHCPLVANWKTRWSIELLLILKFFVNWDFLSSGGKVETIQSEVGSRQLGIFNVERHAHVDDYDVLYYQLLSSRVQPVSSLKVFIYVRNLVFL